MYCVRCVTPDTRPNITFDAEGVCNACRNHESKATIDWESRAFAFTQVAENARRRSVGYDCVIPVSGGKDSTWQTIVCLEHRLRPLAVTWRTPGRTEIGQRNLDNLVGLGVDHVDYRVAPDVERRFMLAALERRGTPAIPMHLAIFNIPLKIATRFDIPLVVWGENSAFEYGGRVEERTGSRLDAEWVRRYGATHGTTARDWVSEELSERELTAYFGPTDAELDAKGVLATFLGYYFRWDPERSLTVAKSRHFERRSEGPRTGLYDYADIDDDFISIHHWLKWYKFGFTRTFDNLSIEIREGRMTRQQAVSAIRARSDETPWEDIERFSAYVGITTTRFFEIAERFRNREVWERRNGRWTIPDFIVPDREWT